MTDWWVRGTFFCCWVLTDENDRIVDTAPILWKFRGQPFSNLTKWRCTLEVRQLLT